VSEITLPDQDTPNTNIYVSGTQRVRKFNKTTEDDVLILVAIRRLKKHGVDLVLTENIPSPKDGSQPTHLEHAERLKKSFHEIAKSLNVVDHGLFA
jgi:hypothetical protein